MRRKAVVAMSGGVDSSVAAALLVEQGYDVTGIMLKLWKGEAENNASGCCNLGAAEDARRVADVLGIPFYVFNFADRFEETVVRDFHDTYASGRTPNPCIRCNQWIKFDALFERARALGADVLATGHYARVEQHDGCYHLLRGVDSSKDQSYVLWMLTQEELAHSLFPVGSMAKTETRRIAGELGLRTADKPDSQEICFVRAGDVGSYVAEKIPEASVPGPLVDASGAVLGEHKGIGNYTIGQRKGLGVSLGEPVFVSRIEPATNTVVVGGRDELVVDGFAMEETSFVDDAPPDGAAVEVQHRAHGDVSRGRLWHDGDTWEVGFDEPVRAIAPGQSAALYADDRLLGGGIISSTKAADRVA
ncbi:MAG: tRNA 2-thiouridine(34) synthase MnmA [Actinomycetota bacterium]